MNRQIVKIKNIEKTALRIKEAIANEEKIILYGDSDLDGVSSVIILQEAIKNINGKVYQVMFPDRENDGYGLNDRAIDFLKEKSPALFIALDLGISNVKEVDILNKMGFNVIIIDHHQIINDIPKAQIVVDPHQEEDFSEYKYLSNAGIVFKLVQELLKENFSENMKNNFQELVALAAIADMVPQEGENKIFLEEGIRSLGKTLRPGLRVFLDIFGPGKVMSGDFGKIVSALNSAQSINFNNEAYELLTSSSKEKCQILAQKLINQVNYKQQKIKKIAEEVEKRIIQKPSQSIIFEGDPAWQLVLAGSVASIIYLKYNKPTFIFKKGDKESCGSVRSPKNTDSVQAMKTCADFLMTYGGHAQAAGFRVKNENIDKFKNCLNNYFSN